MRTRERPEGKESVDARMDRFGRMRKLEEDEGEDARDGGKGWREDYRHRRGDEERGQERRFEEELRRPERREGVDSERKPQREITEEDEDLDRMREDLRRARDSRVMTEGVRSTSSMERREEVKSERHLRDEEKRSAAAESMKVEGERDGIKEETIPNKVQMDKEEVSKQQEDEGQQQIEDDDANSTASNPLYPPRSSETMCDVGYILVLLFS